jgi:hypothetical protein
MNETSEQSPHWMERERLALAVAGRPASARTLANWSHGGFLLCAGVALGYGLWAARGSGRPVQTTDVTREMESALGSPVGNRVGNVHLEPGMSPLRAVLHAWRTPVGSSRLHYEVALEDSAEAVVWECSGFFGSRDEEASLVITQTSLATFDVPREGDYHLRVRTFGASMDDLREARIELRRNVSRVDERIPWGFGIAALACLVTSLVSRGRGAPILERLRNVA